MSEHLFGMRPDDLAAALAAQGEPDALSDARRALAALVSRGEPGLPPRMRRGVERTLHEHFSWQGLAVIDRFVAPEDGSVRYLFAAPDGARFEAVRIPLHRPGRFTLCLSSQAGCAMGCDFCATGRLGLGRHLAPWEIVAQWAAVRDETDGRVTGAVFMGQGEPLHNYDAVIQAARVLSDPCGGRIKREAISISTVGLAPQIRRYTMEGHPYRLLVSLTSAVPARRAALLPVAGRAPLDELVAAIRAHAEASGDRVTVAWVLLGGVNTGPDEVAALGERFDGVPIRLNLIDVNDARPDGYRRATDAERGAFHDGLRALGVPVVRRYSVGQSQHGACGMLASRDQALGT